MKIKISCDQLPNAWNYDTCHCCKHFSITISSKGRNWTCSLNKKPASQKRAFYSIWATEFLRNRGIDIAYEDITIEFVGKR